MRTTVGDVGDHDPIVGSSEDTMSARTIELPSHLSLSSRAAGRSAGTTVRTVLAWAIVALTLALLSGAYAYFGGAVDGYPDPTQQWTD
jgi:hypothetical protein